MHPAGSCCRRCCIWWITTHRLWWIQFLMNNLSQLPSRMKHDASVFTVASKRTVSKELFRQPVGEAEIFPLPQVPGWSRIGTRHRKTLNIPLPLLCLQNLCCRPFSPSIIDVKYPAFTNEKRNTPTFIDINDPETIRKVKIKTNGHIYFIAHGFLESGDRPWVKKLVNALLDLESAATVVVVDWKGGSSPPYYQAVANIRLIGAITAHVVYSIYVSWLPYSRIWFQRKELQEEVGLENLEKVHLIGHSLGAHLRWGGFAHFRRNGNSIGILIENYLLLVVTLATIYKGILGSKLSE